MVEATDCFTLGVLNVNDRGDKLLHIGVLSVNDGGNKLLQIGRSR